MGKGSHAKQTRHDRRAAESARAAGHDDRDESPDDAEAIFLPPLRPRPRLVIALGVVLVLWVGFLLFLYFQTVLPERRANPRPAAPLPSETAKP